MLPDDIQVQFDPPELQSRANPNESENSKQNYFHSIKKFLQVDCREDIFIESLAVPFAWDEGFIDRKACQYYCPKSNGNIRQKVNTLGARWLQQWSNACTLHGHHQCPPMNKCLSWNSCIFPCAWLLRPSRWRPNRPFYLWDLPLTSGFLHKKILSYGNSIRPGP